MTLPPTILVNDQATNLNPEDEARMLANMGLTGPGADRADEAAAAE